MRRARPILILSLLALAPATTALARDPIYLHYHDFRADLGLANASVRRATALTRLPCDAALNAAAYRQFAEIDRWVIADYHRYYTGTTPAPRP